MQNDEELVEKPQAGVEITLKLDAAVYENFRQKALRAGVGVESYLCRTLSIVLGCRAFNDTLACSPQITGAERAQSTDEIS